MSSLQDRSKNQYKLSMIVSRIGIEDTWILRFTHYFNTL